MWLYSRFALAALVLSLASPVTAESQHERRWNRFAESAFALHERQLSEHEVRTETRTGGYANYPDFYREVEYYDRESGKLLSRLQWEQDAPETLHSIEVFVRDAEGRVLRDYTVAWLPDYRKAPSQTLIALHRYNEGLHAFRSFDASGDRLYERCEGTYRGREVVVEVDQDMLHDARLDPGPIFESEDYRLCYGDLPTEVDAFLPPR